MNDFSTTAFLDLLVERAKTVGTRENPPLTAERLLVALIDMIGDTEEIGKGEEFRASEALLRGAIGDLTLAKATLLDYINDGHTILFDDLYMRKKLHEASADKQITAPELLGLIFGEPSETVAKILVAPPLKTTPDGDVESAQPTPPQPTPPTPPQFVPPADPAQPATPKRRPTLAELLGQSSPAQPVPEPQVNRTPAESKAAIANLIGDVKRIRSELGSSIFGQDHAINVFATGYFQASMLSMIDHSRKRPQATFLFAGPPGVGKTFLAEKAAEALGLPFMRFDMSEYADHEANVEFCGADKVYKNAKQGNVTGFVAEHPKCVLLFDEIEKAHLSVIHLFLQMLDAGRLRDNYTDREVSFAQAIVILTTNAGRQLYGDTTADLSAVSRKVIVRALEKDVSPDTGMPLFPAAICSRFASGNVVMFNHITAGFLRSIAKKEIERHAKNLAAETGISLDIDESVYTALLFAEGAAADARTVRARAESFFNDELYELFRLVGSDDKGDISAIENISVSLDLGRASAEIRSLFEPTETPSVLVFADPETASACRTKLTGFDVATPATLPDALASIKESEPSLVLLDMAYGAGDASISLNIEDVDSPARDLYRFLRESRSATPVYLLESPTRSLGEEEKVTFFRQGVRGVLSASADGFADEVSAISEALHQQLGLEKLARANKLVGFETAQTVSPDGKNASIRLFDLRMSVAVDSEDSKNVLSAVSRPNVRFDEVIGAEEAKEELKYFVEYLRDPKKYLGTGVKAPKGVLLYGPPGTGKTMLAKAMAAESGVTFIAAEGNQFLKKYVGEGSEKVHELFTTARKYAPSILFIDEIDAIAKERRGDGNGEAEATLTAFLAEMDGFVNDPSRPVFVLAATNFDVEPGRAKSLDPAMMRRFDRRVYIDLPSKDDRIRFLRMKLAANPAFEISDAQIDTLALRSTGMSLAELDSALELALRSAIRTGSTKVDDAVLEEAFETFTNGERKHWDESQLERVARHEAGHAFLCWQAGETPSYLTVVARGDHGGYMQHADNEGKAIYTRDELLARIRTSLGGRAAELVYYGEKDGVSTGASGDLASATNTAHHLLCTYGMDAEFGLAVVGSAAANGEMSAEIRASVNKLLDEQMAESVRLISENRAKIDALVETLLVKNHLTGPQIDAILKGETL